MTNEFSQGNKIYDLADRTFDLSKSMLNFIRGFPKDRYIEILLNQLLRSTTSVGANYIEADEASTRKEFFYRINICRKEAKESIYWLRLLANTYGETDAPEIMDELGQLVAIFSKILSHKQ